MVTSFVAHVDGEKLDRRTLHGTNGRLIVGGLAQGTFVVGIEAYRWVNGAPGTGPLVGETDVDLAEGETKKVTILARAPITIAGRVVAWPEMTPLSGVSLRTHGALGSESSPTLADGSFRIEIPATGKIELSTHDARGENERWTRDVPQGVTAFDVGDLACAKGRGGPSFAYDVDGKRALVMRARDLDVQPNDEIVSVGGHPVATLGAASLAGIIEAAAPTVPIVIRTGGGTRTAHHTPGAHER
jgi:hypothetical protein